MNGVPECMFCNFSPHSVHVSLVIFGFLFSNFRHVLIDLYFLQGNSAVSVLWTVLRTNGRGTKVLTTFSGKCEIHH